jgi:hypothetical protein
MLIGGMIVPLLPLRMNDAPWIAQISIRRESWCGREVVCEGKYFV